MILPPGTILQFMYIKERLRRLKPGKFIEIGVGQGHLSNLLLNLGWRGTGLDLNPTTIQVAKKNNENYIKSGKYTVQKADWLASKKNSKANLIISSMVLEHLKPEDENKFLQKALRSLNPGGILVLLIPSCPDYWGIDDELAGHYRRYTFQDLTLKTKKIGFDIINLVGLTYPLSNITFPFSEYLVLKAEAKKKSLSMAQKTKLSGNRNVPFKTTYPWFFSLILNEFCLYPFYLLQKMNSKNEKSLIIYAELIPRAQNLRKNHAHTI